MATLVRVPRILITPGEPSGIGPDVALQVALLDFPAELVVVADLKLMEERAALLNLAVQFSETNLDSPPLKHVKNTLKILPIQLIEKVTPGKLNVANAPYVLQCLEEAVDLCMQQKASALVTGPVQKNILNEAGIPFTGHTEFLAERCGVKLSIMLFVVDDLKVALLTTHLPLAKVPQAITAEKLETTLRLLHQELQTKFGIKQPTIVVCGLNPHAGENGVLGHEEIEIIQPVLDKLRKENLSLIGPLPSDTVFTPQNLNSCDAILAMYHDQALPVIKHIGFDRAVNVTLGLPIVRTSVDHGTALPLAGKGKANSNSLKAAIDLAIDLCHASAIL